MSRAVNRWLVTTALAGLVAALPCAASDAARPAPQFALPSLKDGSTVQLAEYRGRVVLVDFWASWCSPCLQSMPAYNGLAARFADRGFQILAISVDEKSESARAFVEKHPVRYVVLSDPHGEVAAAYDIKGMPSSFLVDGQGRIRQVHVGFKPDDIRVLDRQITQLLEER